MFYVLVEAAAVGLNIVPEQAADLVDVAEVIKRAAREQLSVTHPTNPDINHLESLLWWGPAKSPDNDGRNTVVMSLGSGDPSDPMAQGGVLDRCPCGTGTAARVAVLHAKGELGLSEEYRHEGILDSVYTGRPVSEADLAGTASVVPEISGQAWISGFFEHVIHDDDPFQEGFLLLDR